MTKALTPCGTPDFGSSSTHAAFSSNHFLSCESTAFVVHFLLAILPLKSLIAFTPSPPSSHDRQQGILSWQTLDAITRRTARLSDVRPVAFASAMRSPVLHPPNTLAVSPIEAGLTLQYSRQPSSPAASTSPRNAASHPASRNRIIALSLRAVSHYRRLPEDGSRKSQLARPIEAGTAIKVVPAADTRRVRDRCGVGVSSRMIPVDDFLGSAAIMGP
ncbi:hypothetical protein HDK90DRAFT_523144 [Phyllosticta capitalensis]|uniref:Uncharacterized protein n=1 Tax=Phyllosticta capitalensis TaxID=121624 RepID=A0ABR1YVT1_9PEZI